MNFELWGSRELAQERYHLQERCWRGDMNAYPLLQQALAELRSRGLNMWGQACE